MEQIRCHNCGSVKLVENGRFYTCEYCGGRIERSNYCEPADTSHSSGLEKLLERADLYWNVGRRDMAKKLYRQALDIDASIERAKKRAR